VNIASVIGYQVSHAAEDRHSAADTVHERYNVGQSKITAGMVSQTPQTN
jgi:hypothetical protein